ncbi:MAG: AMP-binding protein, partial [Acidobacteria bacterium]|nr:AMP-binding protein [Acidobacteriota bacterium]
TGNPKGVLITHENLSPLLHWGYQNLGIGENDRALQNLSYYFDWSVWEMFIVLTTGASLYMVSENILLDAAACVDFINRHRLTVLHITPTQYRYIVKSPAVPVTLRYLFIGAEKLTYDLVERSFASVSGTCRVLNMYGPTEATIISAVLEIHRECLEKFKSLNSIPIGRPAGNTTLLILDKYRNLCPINIPGELYIGGDGLSQGYLNNPELTNERFIFTRVAFEKAPLAPPKLLIIHHSPLTTHHSPLYKTGDLARWLSDGPPAGGASGGVIEYLGRLDEQVKIRGFRIELGEIESFLVKREEIKEAVVIDWEGENKEKYLCAYIVFKSGTEENINGLKDYLTQNLPNYMIPSFFIKIEKIPLNANGKIDRKALPLPALTGKGKEEYTAPGNETEKKLAQIWSDILGIPGDKISIDSNFFELGGHSLKASIMLSQIKAQLNCTFALVEIFTKPTPRELAAYILSFPGINSTASLQDENLVLLKKGTESGKHLYMVHAGSGDVEEYIEFFENLGRLEPGLNGWGIRFDQLKNGCPQNITVEALAARYIEKIKKIQNKGPYMIAGWSIGGTIAFEMTRQLETLNEATAFLALVDTPNPQVDLTSQTQDFTLETELSRLKEIIPGLANHNKIENITDIEQLWFLIADYLEDLPFDTGKLRAVIPGYVIQTLPNIDQLNHRDLIFNINRVRTLNNARNRYIPSGKIRTPMYFYGSNEKGKIYAEAWKDYCAFQKYNELETDHYNMFKMPHAAVLAKLFNRGIQ